MFLAVVDVSDIFTFLLLGEGEGESEAPGGGGDRFSIENPREGGGFPGLGGAGRVSAANWGMGGGGLNIFFRGRNAHQVANAGLLEMQP